MTYRVIQWATGGVGRAAIEGVLAHPELELVGCWVHSADKDGHDVGELVGAGADRRTAATTDSDALLALDADCVVYSPLMADPRVVDRASCARARTWSRRSAGSTRTGRRARPASTRVAKEGRVTLHGTGIHPGGITERFPLMVSALSGASPTCGPRSSPTSAPTTPPM